MKYPSLSIYFAFALCVAWSFHAHARVPGVAFEEVILNIEETESNSPNRKLVDEHKIIRTTGDGKKVRKNLHVEGQPNVAPAEIYGSATCTADRAERTVQLDAFSVAEGSAQDRSFPENTRQVQSAATTNYRDHLMIRSDESFSNVRVELSFSYELLVNAKKANALSGGGGSTASIQAIVVDQQEDKILSGSNVGTGSGNMKDKGEFTLSVSGNLGPEGFRNGSGLYFSMSAFAATSATTFYTVEYAGISFIHLSAIRVFDSNGDLIPPGRLKFDSTTGRDYRPVFSVDPFDGDSTSLRGSISPAGGAPIDGSNKGFFGAIDALLRPILNQSGPSLLRGMTAEPAFTFTTKLALGKDQFTIKGTFGSDGVAHFTPGDSTTRRVTRKDGSQLDIALMLNRMADPPTITGTLSETSGTVRGDVRMDLHQFTKSSTAPIYYPFVPEEMLGAYTVALPAVVAPNRGLSQNAYPAGAGVARLVVAPGGTVRLAGKLADGTPLSVGGIITTGGRLFFYTPLYKSMGAVGGTLEFEDVDESDAATDELVWIRPAQTKTAVYPAGWINGVDLKLRASKYVVPPKRDGLSVFSGVGPESSSGNLILRMGAAGLPDGDAGDLDPESPFTRPLNVTAKNRVSVAGTNDLAIKPGIVVPTGTLRGSFLVPGDARSTPFQSVILQKSQTATGYFLRNGESGLVEVELPPATP